MNPTEKAPVVIIGSGLAGFTLAKEIRKRSADIPLHMVCADDGDAYSKPMLSNALAKNKTPAALIMASSEKMATDLQMTLWNHTRVNGIDTAQKILDTDRGPLQYRALALALGADPIRIPLQGNAADAVLSVNDLQDYRRFCDAIQGKQRVLIMGAGLIGCEFANDLREYGMQVDVVDLAPQPLGRLLPPQAAGCIQQALGQLGVAWHLGCSIRSINHDPEGYRITLSSGEQLTVDVVLSAVGLRPRTELASTHGIRCNRGICVDRHLQTEVAGVYALGDCAEVEGLVLPFVMPLMNAARALAATLCGDETEVQYPAMPVVVKTPAMPLVVSPPAADIGGQWQEQASATGVRSLFHGEDGSLQGFALCGDAASEKMKLTKELPDILPPSQLP